MDRKFRVYLSHSWRPRDVELNLWVWERLADSCDLLVDKPDSQDDNPPYYVSRLEEIMRRCDLFVSILPYRENKDAADASGDHALQCSAGSLFEVRLAERARRPRLVLYERDTGFIRPTDAFNDEKYIPFDRGADQVLPEGLDSIEREIASWLEYVNGSRKPRFSEPPLDRSVVLLPESLASETENQLSKALQAAQFFDVERVRFEKCTDAALVHKIFNTGLIVADVASSDTRELYAIAHTLFVPTIRLAPQKDAPLFWILQGHPGGYQHDIVSLSQAVAPDSPWPGLVTARAKAIFQVTEPLSLDTGRRYIKSRRYKGSYVFLSHNLRPGKRDILDLLIAKLRDEQIDFFEYYRDNQAGIQWEPMVDVALGKTTIFAALLADGYEDSPICLKEWGAGTPGRVILPFLVNGRVTRTNLTPLHNETLDSTDPATNADIIFSRVKAAASGTPV